MTDQGSAPKSCKTSATATPGSTSIKHISFSSVNVTHIKKFCKDHNIQLPVLLQRLHSYVDSHDLTPPDIGPDVLDFVCEKLYPEMCSTLQVLAGTTETALYPSIVSMLKVVALFSNGSKRVATKEMLQLAHGTVPVEELRSLGVGDEEDLGLGDATRADQSAYQEAGTRAEQVATDSEAEDLIARAHNGAAKEAGTGVEENVAALDTDLAAKKQRDREASAFSRMTSLRPTESLFTGKQEFTMIIGTPPDDKIHGVNEMNMGSDTNYLDALCQMMAAMLISAMLNGREKEVLWGLYGDYAQLQYVVLDASLDNNGKIIGGSFKMSRLFGFPMSMIVDDSAYGGAPTALAFLLSMMVPDLVDNHSYDLQAWKDAWETAQHNIMSMSQRPITVFKKYTGMRRVQAEEQQMMQEVKLEQALMREQHALVREHHALVREQAAEQENAKLKARLENMKQ